MNFIRIEVTNCCNLRCKMCPQSTSINRKRGMMERWLFEKIINDASNHVGRIPVTFHISGEPLLHPLITDFIKLSGEHFIPWLVTNATLLTKDIGERLIDSGVKRISFSFEGINKEVYEAIRVGAIYEETLSNIESFLLMNSQRGHPVETELVCVDVPTIPVPEIKRFLDQMTLKFDIINRSGYFDWLGKVGESSQNVKSGRGCHAMKTDLNVLFDGKVIPCCMDVDGTMVYGDFSTMNFSQIMQSKSRNDLSSKLESGNFEGLSCSKCHVPVSGTRKLRG